jgi:hypothetical protein
LVKAMREPDSAERITVPPNANIQSRCPLSIQKRRVQRREWTLSRVRVRVWNVISGLICDSQRQLELL